MKVLIRERINNRKTFIEIRQITLEETSNGRFSLNATDMMGKKIILKNLSKERADDIETKICQDFVIDLTPEFEEFKNKEKTPQQLVDDINLQFQELLQNKGKSL